MPSATVRDYNRLSSDRPGSVFGLKVHFNCQVLFFTFRVPCFRFVLSIIRTLFVILIPKKNRFIFCYFVLFILFKIIRCFLIILGEV